MPLLKVLGTIAIACSGRSKGVRGRRTLPSPIFLIFLQFRQKVMPNNRLAPPSRGDTAPVEILDPALASMCNYKNCVLENSHEKLCNW